jgi:hypothetical protein
MALQIGTEKKWKIYLVAGLIFVSLLGVVYEVKSYYFGGTSAPPPPVAAARPAALPSSATNSSAHGQEAQKLSNAGIDPALHLEILARSERIEYQGTGRNIFSAQSAPRRLKSWLPVRVPVSRANLS